MNDDEAWSHVYIEQPLVKIYDQVLVHLEVRTILNEMISDIQEWDHHGKILQAQYDQRQVEIRLHAQQQMLFEAQAREAKARVTQQDFEKRAADLLEVFQHEWMPQQASQREEQHQACLRLQRAYQDLEEEKTKIMRGAQAPAQSDVLYSTSLCLHLCRFLTTLDVIAFSMTSKTAGAHIDLVFEVESTPDLVGNKPSLAQPPVVVVPKPTLRRPRPTSGHPLKRYQNAIQLEKAEILMQSLNKGEMKIVHEIISRLRSVEVRLT